MQANQTLVHRNTRLIVANLSLSKPIYVWAPILYNDIGLYMYINYYVRYLYTYGVICSVNTTNMLSKSTNLPY